MGKLNKATLIAGIIVLFGIMTVVSGGRALFTESGSQAGGQIVPVVLWFNFIAGFFYIVAGVHLFKLNAQTKKLSLIIASANVIVLTYLLIHIFAGGLYETRTLFAMSFRTVFWGVVAVYLNKSNIFKFAG